MRISIITEVNNLGSQELKELLTTKYDLKDISEPRWEMYKILSATVADDCDIEAIKKTNGVKWVEGEGMQVL